MSQPLPDNLARQLLGAPDGGTLLVFGAYLTAWGGAQWEAGTGANTVADGAQEFHNLPYLGPISEGAGPVLLIQTPAAPIILGRIYRPDPA